MLAVHARYRGRATRRAELVERSAAALSTLDGVGEFEFLGVEDICAEVDTATAVCEVAMALLADGSWAISIGVSGNDAKNTATSGLKASARPGQVYASMEPTVSGGVGVKAAKDKPKKDAAIMAAAFSLLALVSDGSWATFIGGFGNEAERDSKGGLEGTAGPGQVYASIEPTVSSGVGVKAAKDKAKKDSANIVAAFSLLSFVLGKRTSEGREATSLVRSGLNQNEAAEELGISKQAMSQRLRAAGWAAEGAGWQLAVNLIAAANPDSDI